MATNNANSTDDAIKNHAKVGENPDAENVSADDITKDYAHLGGVPIANNTLYHATGPAHILEWKETILLDMPYLKGGFPSKRAFLENSADLLSTIIRMKRFVTLVKNPLDHLMDGRIAKFLRRLNQVETYYSIKIKEEGFDPTNSEQLDSLIDFMVQKVMDM